MTFLLMDYNKKALSLNDQILFLKEAGFDIDDNARTILSNVSYFGMKEYMNASQSKSFSEGFMIYNFDRELRSILFSEIQTIEVSFRTKLINNFSCESPFWFADYTSFYNKHQFSETLSKIESEYKRSKEPFVERHRKYYGENEFMPVWKTFQLVTFGTLSKIYFNFSKNKLKKKVAHQYNLPSHEILQSWILSICELRNYCAIIRECGTEILLKYHK